MGWRLESGCRYRGVLHILDYEDAKAGKLTLDRFKHIPEKEVVFPEALMFTFAEQRKLAIETMQPPPGLPESHQLHHG